MPIYNLTIPAGQSESQVITIGNNERLRDLIYDFDGPESIFDIFNTPPEERVKVKLVLVHVDAEAGENPEPVATFVNYMPGGFDYAEEIPLSAQASGMKIVYEPGSQLKYELEEQYSADDPTTVGVDIELTLETELI